MSNKYLEKIAVLKGISKAWMETPGPTRLSLGVGTASLGVGTANYVSSQQRARRQSEQKELERKSLSALQGIHRTLVQQSS